MHSLTTGVWHESGPVRIIGMPLTATMTVLDLGGGDLLVHSPLPLTPERRAEITSLGRVAHLYAPNTFHHLWLGDWSASFPEAQVHAPSALASKRPDLRIDRFHDRALEPISSAITEIPIEGFRLAETTLVHHASGTVVVADLVHNIGRPKELWTRLYTSLMGFYDSVAISRVIRWTAFNDRRAARRSVDALLAHSFDRVIVGHGAPIASSARDVLAIATAWLPVGSTPRLAAHDTRMLFGKPCG